MIVLASLAMAQLAISECDALRFAPDADGPAPPASLMERAVALLQTRREASGRDEGAR